MKKYIYAKFRNNSFPLAVKLNTVPKVKQWIFLIGYWFTKNVNARKPNDMTDR